MGIKEITISKKSGAWVLTSWDETQSPGMAFASDNPDGVARAVAHLLGGAPWPEIEERLIPARIPGVELPFERLAEQMKKRGGN